MTTSALPETPAKQTSLAVLTQEEMDWFIESINDVLLEFFN